MTNLTDKKTEDMGMIGIYMMIDEAKRKQMAYSDNLKEAVERYEEEEAPEVYNMGKLWDGLHFLLTGIPAGDAEKRPPVSAAVLGSCIYSCEVHIGFNNRKHLAKIVPVLNDINIDELLAQMEIGRFAEADIYPDIWYEEDEKQLKAQLREEFLGLKAFYEKAQMQKKGVIVSIY